MFAYPPLKETSAGNLRLLRIDGTLDGSPSGDLCCTLVAAQPWITGEHYECLSYCWGNSTEAGRLFIRTSEHPTCNYKQVKVSMNLCSAMRKLRSTHTMKWLWIDAISIDQSNLKERASQVAMMKDIYSKASGVVIWLGEGDRCLTASVSTISAISERFQVDTRIAPTSIVGPDGLRLTAIDIEQLRSYVSIEILGTTLEHAYKLLAHFFALPWFRRVWVLQEAFAHNKITVRLGEHTLPWGAVILAAIWASGFTRTYIAKSANEYPAEGAMNRGYLPELWLGLLHTRATRGLSMLELVSRTRDFEASDPRDKVFGLLGLANDVGNPQTRTVGLRPDYTKSKNEVYAAFAKDLITNTGSLDVLSLVNTFTPRTQNQELVSWMPNLDARVATIRGLGFPRKYNASFSTIANVDIVTQHKQDNLTLVLSGFYIDTVHYVTESTMSFSRDLKVYIKGHIEAVTELWKTYVRCSNPGVPENIILQSYIELMAAAGFAMPTEFPAYPLGKIVPSREVPSLVADFAAYWSRVEPEFSSFSEALGSRLKQLAELGNAEQFGVLAGKACHERHFFLTARGRIGLCPRDAQEGDRIVILYGGSVPYVSRARERGNWTFVGECYVDGIMFGEAEKIQRQDQIFPLL
ncbi:HET-domain-containing protein [Cucurbitaria berberidis CBS 394.84]|uniref:HET-domain-containing protein n=1 Tax=Cucurbitaria berberidis CBS 394.84 TaxID=1168544 RepID=A0A9P4GB34_9PLEO|nr:HET-domain-containing protein [Cucurbitaria berberidis CBS 394.84]KAF1842264.1 HET-domain-containing protein [Cucurbitaria berberidis CBS 394.84]